MTRVFHAHSLDLRATKDSRDGREDFWSRESAETNEISLVAKVSNKMPFQTTRCIVLRSSIAISSQTWLYPSLPYVRLDGAKQGTHNRLCGTRVPLTWPNPISCFPFVIFVFCLRKGETSKCHSVYVPVEEKEIQPLIQVSMRGTGLGTGTVPYRVSVYSLPSP